MEGENVRSREAVRNSIRTYGVKVMDPASLPLKKTKETESKESVSRFSEKSLHSQYEIEEGFSKCCKSCLNRIPYATLLATVLCLFGIIDVVISAGRCTTLTRNMLQDNFNKRSELLESVYTAFVVLEIVTVVAALLTLFVGILATGDTREKVCKGWQARVGGRLCCALLMGLMLVVFFLWMAAFWALGTMVFMAVIANTQCSDFLVSNENQGCLHLPELSVLFPGEKDKFEICVRQAKSFCKDYVEKVEHFFVATELGVFIVIFSVVLYLICLSANYARIRCQAKYQELHDLQGLNGDNRDRF